MWLRTETANEQLKQDAQSQDVDGLQSMPVLYMTLLEDISQQ